MKRVSSSRKSASDLKRLATLKDSEILIDDDAPAWTPEMFARAVVQRGLRTPPTKTLLSLRVDSDVVEWFRAQGRGYQSRMNALLRAYMDAHRQSRKRAS
ncbi:MAG: BrnA antitoxin family protein [Casimicrobiaceae bacterium]